MASQERTCSYRKPCPGILCLGESRAGKVHPGKVHPGEHCRRNHHIFSHRPLYRHRDLIKEGATKRNEKLSLTGDHFFFPIKDLSKPHAPRLHITQDHAAETLIINQFLCEQLVAENYEIDKTSVIPASAKVKPLSKVDGPQIDAEIEKRCNIPYRAAVGVQALIANIPWPSLSHVVYYAKFCDKPGSAHSKLVLKLLQ